MRGHAASSTLANPSPDSPDGVRWADGSAAPFDAMIWCTGFRPALTHLAALGVVDDAGRVDVEGTRNSTEPRLWLVGYGDRTGMASATLIGVMRTARSTCTGDRRLPSVTLT